jgi:predicted secreted protein
MRSHPRTPSDRQIRSARKSRRRSAVVLVLGILTLVAGCSGGSSSSSNDSATTTTVVAPEATPTYVDPAAPITTTIGKEFAIMLPADPGSGWRWVLAPIDNSRLIALGSRFSDDPDLLTKAESATTTTTTAVRAGNATTSSTTGTTLPVVLPLVQIISFAGRAAGPATISFSYNQIAGEPQAQNKVVTFTVQVVPSTSTTTR